MNRRRMLSGALASAAAASLPVWSATVAAPVAGTRSGKVRGYTDRDIRVFKGLPYGRAARFQPPQPGPRWSAVRDGSRYGPASPQPRAEEPVSEECLFLNVWTPGLDAARRPVMVYIHGGAYSRGSGSSPLYDGVSLCRRGNVVVVTINHRLSAFGYLYLARLGTDPGLVDSGNAGMLDLVLALQWVRDNIATFGGDPQRVMLFGQSGGGAKIATLMAMPAAKGLFHRAATMSGQQLTASGPFNATQRAHALLDALRLEPEQIDALRTMPHERIVDALDTTDPIIGRGSLYFGPVLDERTLQRHPFYPDAPPLSAHIPMIIGNTRDETRSLIGVSDPTAFSLSWDDLPYRLAAELRVDVSPEIVVAEYRRIYPRYSPSDVFFAATTASRSWRAAVVEAELRAQQGSPAYVYQLDWKSPQDGGKWGAPHTLDIPLAFDNPDKQGSITGTDERARRMAERMAECFIAFAHKGDPNHAGIPAWSPYDLSRRQTLIFDDDTRMEDDPRGAERRLFSKVPFIQQGT
jgi:para-nitrobenzyl esterase